VLAAFLTTILFAFSAVAAARTTRVLGSLDANFWRILVATGLLGLWAHSFGQGISGVGFPFFLLSGAIGFGIGDLALYYAYPRLGARLSIMLVHCLASPIATAIEWLWLGTTISITQMLCSTTILVGVAIALAPGKHFESAGRTLLLGILFGSIAAFGQGFGAVLSRKAYAVAESAGQSVDGLTAAYQRILAGLVIATISMLLGKLQDKTSLKLPPAETKMPIAFWVVLNALAGPTLGVSCYQWALATTPTGLVLPIVAITPLMVIPFARYIEGERPSKRSLAGGVIAVLGAVALATTR
jgi:drug/metabolite transporter (DMT)-like permease